MTRSTILKCLSVPALLVAVVTSAGLAGSAKADHNSGSTYCAPYRPVHGHFRSQSEWRQYERARGERDGERAGWKAGYEAGYHGRAHNCVCTIDLSCESVPYQRGFRNGFDCGYDRGYYAGKAARERERCRVPFNPRRGYRDHPISIQPIKPGFRFDIRF